MNIENLNEYLDSIGLVNKKDNEFIMEIERNFREEFEKVFNLAMKNNLIKYEIEDNWLRVSYKFITYENTINSNNNNYEWYLVCARNLIPEKYEIEDYNIQSIEEYVERLISWVIMHLAQGLVSTEQNCNILKAECK